MKKIISVLFLILLIPFLSYSMIRNKKSSSFTGYGDFLRNDSIGKGHFGASRGGKSHNGIDVIVKPNSAIYAPMDMIYIRHFKAYSDDSRFNGMEFQSIEIEGLKIKVMYIDSIVYINDICNENSIIGYAQDISEKYNGAMPHLHIEARLNGVVVNPNNYLNIKN